MYVAIYHFSLKVISRGKGRSSTAAAAYRGALDITDERTGELHRYTNRGGVLDHAILTPSRAPEWAKDAASLWNAVEEKERRVDAQLARENVVALPHELTHEQNRELLHGFVQEAYVKRGMAAQVNIHAPSEEGNERNIHAHVMLTMRGINRNGWQEKKARNWNEKATLNEWRTLWAEYVNRALEKSQIKERVSEKSFEDLGLDKVPSKHLGPEASEMERRGEQSRIGDENREANAQNRKMAALAMQQEVLQKAVKAEAYALADEKRKAVEAERERREREDREFLSRNRNLVAEAVIAQQENAKAHALRELLDRGPVFWQQVEREYAEEEQQVRAYYQLERQAEDLREAQERAHHLDTVNGRMSGAYDAAMDEAASIARGLEDARQRQAEALDKLASEQAILREAREERAQVMSAKLDAQFEAQRGGMEMPEVAQAREQDNAPSVSIEDTEQTCEMDQGRDDDMDLSR